MDRHRRNRAKFGMKATEVAGPSRPNSRVVGDSEKVSPALGEHQGDS
jgi:hypothetical protein